MNKVIAAPLLLLLGACAAAPYLVPAGIDFARNLLTAAANNYGGQYSEEVSRLIIRLTQPYMNVARAQGTYPGQAGSTQPYPGSPGTYPTQAQGPYPTQPQAPYPDPMQAQSPYPTQTQSPYPAPYPTQAQTPYPTQTQSPYPAQYPAQAPTPYPAQTQSPYPAPYPTQAQTPYPTQTQSPYPAQYPGQAPTPYPTQPQSPYPTPYPAQTQPPQQSLPQYPGQPSQYGGAYPQYPAPGVFPRGVPSQPVAVDVALVTQQSTPQGPRVILMNDGDVLRGNPQNPQAGDKFKLVVRSNCDCYVYMVSIDGSGWAQGIFPAKGSRYPNPVRKDEEYAFPEGANWYALDEVPGVETFYIVLSPHQRPDLEESIARVAGNERPKTRAAGQVTAAAVIPNGFATKDAGRATTVRSEGGQQAQVTPTTYVAKAPGEDVTVTRWFKHE